MNEQELTDKLLATVQLDARLRGPLIAEYLKAVKQVANVSGSAAACNWLQRVISPALDYPSLVKIQSVLAKLQVRDTSSPRLRVAILGGPLTAQLRSLIEVFVFALGLDAEFFEADYGLFRHEILTIGSRLDQFKPQIVFIATSARDVSRLPEDLWQSAADVELLAEQELADWQNLWQVVSSKWGATIIQNNFEIAPETTLGHYHLRCASSQENYLARLNRLFAERSPSNVVLHDFQGLSAAAGARDWFDPRYYLEFKMPCSPACLVAYAHSVSSLIAAIQGRSKKVLVLDLDNTLWGGVVGDVGAGGIRLGQGSSEGEAFVTFQKFAYELYRRGILLAACSKNEERNAREVFEKRTDMILKLAHICEFVANWESKVDNLRAIANRLNLKLDALVFVDDNPAERAVVRRLLPEVAVPDMPEDPSGYVQAVAMHRYFETIALTREDQTRAESYAHNSIRRDLAQRSASIDEFLASLSMRINVEPVNELNLDRVTQLINKSNQFNLTTRRYTKADVCRIAESEQWQTLTFSLRDNLGDSGLISIIFLKKDLRQFVVDTWVMSCRVLQRGVEFFARNELVELARREGYEKIRGVYIATEKNALVRDHYAQLGFTRESEEGGQSNWYLPIEKNLTPLPHYIERE